MKLIGDPARSSDDWDVPLTQVADSLSALKVKAAAEDVERQARRQAERERLMAKLAAYQPVPAPANEWLEVRHLLHDEDPDSTVPAFRVDLVKHKTGGKA